MGKASTHAVVYARLITEGKDYGIHGSVLLLGNAFLDAVLSSFVTYGITHVGVPGFIVQLRSLEDHSPLPGVTLGDIGGKFGSGAYNSMDNGVLRFDHVRIPRDQMLMRFVHLDHHTPFCHFIPLFFVLAFLKFDLLYSCFLGFHKLQGRGNMFIQMSQSSCFMGQWFLFARQ